MIIGLDIGTESVRATLFNEKRLKMLEEYEVSYKIYFPRTEYVEQDPEEIFKAVVKCINKVPKNGDTLYISFSSVLHSVLALDKHGNLLTNLIIWADRRAKNEKDYLKEKFGTRFFYERSGCPVHAIYLPSKILWIKKNYPKAAIFMSIKSYLIYKLTGKMVEDLSVALASGLMNIRKKIWDEEILKIIGIKESSLPTVVSPYNLLPVKAGLSNHFREIFVVPGAGDGMLANLGAGAIKEGTGVITIGTSGAVRTFVKKVVLDKHGIATWCYLLDDELYILGAAINNGGIVLSWIKDLFDLKNYEEIFEEAQKAPPGADGIVFLPFLNGERSPNWIENYKGVVIGLTTFHEKHHILKAAIEGIGFRMKDIFNSVEKVNKSKISKIIATGGFTKSEYLLQTMANVLGRDINITNITHHVAFGAVIIAIKSLKMDWRKFLEESVWITKTIKHDEQLSNTYEELYIKYKYLYETILDYWNNFD